MIRIRLVFSLLALLAMAACSTPHISVDQELQASASPMPVNGRQGWMIGQKLSFGEFSTGKVRRGWTKSYDIPFIVRFSGAKERLSFDMQDSQGLSANVFCLGKLREQDLPLFNDLFEVNLGWKDVFSGTVTLNDGERHYDFLVANLNQNNWFREASGFIRYQGGEIELQPVNRLANGKKMLSENVPGFQFVYQGQVVGAVETLNRGQVWIKAGLPQEMRLLLGAMSAALLLRSELADQPLS